MASRAGSRITTVLGVIVVVGLLAGAGYVVWDRNRAEAPSATGARHGSPSPSGPASTSTTSTPDTNAADDLRRVLEASAGPGTAAFRRVPAGGSATTGTLAWGAGDSYSVDEGTVRQVRRLGDTVYVKMEHPGVPDNLNTSFQRYPAPAPGELGSEPSSGFVAAALYYLGLHPIDPAKLGSTLLVSRSGTGFSVRPDPASLVPGSTAPADVTVPVTELTVRGGKVVAISSTGLAGAFSATLSYGPVSAPVVPDAVVELES